MSDLNNRLIQCFSLVFPDLPAADIPGASHSNVAAWDSVATITLLAILEEEFRISIELDAFADLDTYEKIHNLVESLLKTSP